MGDLPEGWAWALIDDLIGSKGLFRDGDWVESKDQDPNGDVRLIQLADIGDGEFRNRSARFLTADKAVELGCSYLREGDLLIARMPDPLGRACLFPLKGEHKFVTVVDVCIVRFGHAQIDNRYFLYALNSPASRKRISDFQTGSTRKRISRGNLSTIEFPIPPLPEQHRIVAKIEELFSELDQGVASLKTARAQLKVYRQSLLKNAFSGKLTAKWRAAHRDQLETAAALQQRIASERAARYQQQLAAWQAAGQAGPKPKPPKPLPPLTPEELADLPELPAGWGWVKLADIGNIETGTTPSKSKPENFGGKYPFFKPTDLDAGDNVRVAREFLTEAGLSESRFLPKNSVLVTCIGATIGKVGISRVDGTSNQQINAVIPLGTNPDFVYRQIAGPFFQEAIKANASSTTLPILNKSKFESLAIAVCSLAEQGEIVALLESKLSEADQLDQTLATALQQAEALRQSILKKAFCGQLVPQDPNDEPAATLLERIRAARSADQPARRGRSAGSQS